MKNILLVEDDADILFLYSQGLKVAGYKVTTAEDGKQALEALEKQTFDLILLDIMMPKMNGLQVLKEFKEQNPNSKTRVVMLTNLGQDSVIKEGFRLGADAYLIKASYTPGQVVTEVENILHNQPSNLPTTAPTQAI